MNNVAVMPRFKVKDTVLYKDSATDTGMHAVVLEVPISARYEVPGLGWVYRLAAFDYLIEERHLRSAIETVTTEGGYRIERTQVMGEEANKTPEFGGFAVDLDEAQEGLAAALFKPGQYVRIAPDTSGLDEDDEEDDEIPAPASEFGFIVGYAYWEGAISYDLAVFDPAFGKFIEDPLPYMEEVLILSSREEITKLTRPIVQRPKLSIVR